MKKEIMLGVPEDVELEEHRAMVCMPENTVEATIECRVFHDGELISVCKKLSMSDVRSAFKKADDGYIDDDDTFELTDKGKAFLNEINKMHNP